MFPSPLPCPPSIISIQAARNLFSQVPAATPVLRMGLLCLSPWRCCPFPGWRPSNRAWASSPPLHVLAGVLGALLPVYHASGVMSPSRLDDLLTGQKRVIRHAKSPVYSCFAVCRQIQAVVILMLGGDKAPCASKQARQTGPYGGLADGFRS